MKRRLQEVLGIWDTNLSLMDRLWQLFTVLVIAGGGTIAALQAKASELLGNAGSLAWLGIGLATSLIISFCFVLVRYAGVKGAEKQYIQSMSLRGGGINPLLDSFTDQVIHVHDLYLPGSQLHNVKHFKRCIFVGPGTIAFVGGSYSNSTFSEVGKFIPLPDDTILHGVVVFQDCTVDQCQFIKIAVLAPKSVADKFNALIKEN